MTYRGEITDDDLFDGSVCKRETPPKGKAVVRTREGTPAYRLIFIRGIGYRVNRKDFEAHEGFKIYQRIVVESHHR